MRAPSRLLAASAALLAPAPALAADGAPGVLKVLLLGGVGGLGVLVLGVGWLVHLLGKRPTGGGRLGMTVLTTLALCFAVPPLAYARPWDGVEEALAFALGVLSVLMAGAWTRRLPARADPGPES